MDGGNSLQIFGEFGQVMSVTVKNLVTEFPDLDSSPRVFTVLDGNSLGDY